MYFVLVATQSSLIDTSEKLFIVFILIVANKQSYWKLLI